MVVLARGLPVDHILPGADHSVAASGATAADALGFLEEPAAHLETKIDRSEGADRTNIDGVKRIVVLQLLAGICGQHCITAAINEPEHVIVCNLLGETNAARAKNAAFIIERHTRPEHDVLRLLDFVLEKTRLAPTEIDTELL